MFPAGQGAKHGPWEDPTFTKSTSEIHAPRYFKEYEEFGEDLKKAEDALILSKLLTKEMYDKYKDQKTSLGVTLDKCIKGGDRYRSRPHKRTRRLSTQACHPPCSTQREAWQARQDDSRSSARCCWQRAL
jgi:hypothetical protein